MVLEGYFVFSPEFYKEKTPNYFAEVCKFSLFYLNFWSKQSLFIVIGRTSIRTLRKVDSVSVSN